MAKLNVSFVLLTIFYAPCFKLLFCPFFGLKPFSLLSTLLISFRLPLYLFKLLLRFSLENSLHMIIFGFLDASIIQISHPLLLTSFLPDRLLVSTLVHLQIIMESLSWPHIATCNNFLSCQFWWRLIPVFWLSWQTVHFSFRWFYSPYSPGPHFCSSH